MDDSILELLTKVTLYDLMWTLVLITIIIGVLLSQKKRISKWLDKWRKDKNEQDDFNNLVYELKDSVEGMKQSMAQCQMHLNEEYVSLRSEVYDIINKQSKDIEDLTNIAIGIREKISKTKRAEIKEKIERIYRECHPTMTCADTQFETLKELIEEYEEHGGNNSFVHSIVEKEMYQWEITHRV